MAVVVARILTFFALAGPGLSQFDIYTRTPNTRRLIEGSDTVLAYRLSRDARAILGAQPASPEALIRLPLVHRAAAPQLLGMLDRGADIELFLGWVGPESNAKGFEHHIELYRGRRGTEGRLVHDFTLYGGPAERVKFFRPPGGRDAPAALIDIQGGSYWGTCYLLASDRQSVEKLFDASDYEFADLDRDGVYELIAWNRRPFDVRCHFGIFAVRFYPEVFVRAGSSFRKAWPPPDWPAQDGQLENRFRNRERDGVPWGANFQIVAGFADLAGDGAAELIVLQDRLRDEASQALAVYRLANQSFRLVAQTSLPPQRIAYLLSGIRDSPDGKEILVRTASPAKCESGGDPDATGTAETAYVLQGGRLQPAKFRRP